MKKTLSMVAILLAVLGFLYSAVHIFGTGIKYFEYSGLKSNVKKLTEEKTKKTTELAALTKKNADVKAEYEKLRAEKKIKTVYLTFDDGPSGHTDQILEILKKNKKNFLCVKKVSL